MTIYSQLKVLHHADALAALRDGYRPEPVHVQLILSDLCNQDCHFCAYRMSSGLSNELFPDERGRKNPNRRIPSGKAFEILDDCAELGVKAVQFTGGGEPTVHPDHLAIFAHAQSLGMDTALVTNGVRLDPEAEAIQRMAWIRVSVDAGDAEQYERVRRVPDWHWSKVWANITALASNYQGKLGVGYVVTPDNFRGITSAAKLAYDAGAANIRVGAVFSRDGLRYYGELVSGIGREIEAAKAALAGTGFEVIDLFGRRLGDLEGGPPEHSECHYQYLTVYVGGDLGVYRCCNTAYTRAGKVGDLTDQRLRDAVLDYEPFDARQCVGCQFKGQNAAIRAALATPEHVNFV